MIIAKKIVSLACMLSACLTVVAMQPKATMRQGKTETLLVTVEYGEKGSIKRIVDADHSTPENVVRLVKGLSFSDAEERAAFSNVLFGILYQMEKVSE